MKRLGIIHTTPATIEGLKKKLEEKIEEIEIINILDDSILPDMCGERNLSLVRERWLSYARILEEQGVDMVLSACSTVGEFADEADRLLRVPVRRIDEAMAELAAEEGEKITVLATLPSTLKPTAALLRKKLAEKNKIGEIKELVVEGAFDELKKGNQKEHDRRIVEAVKAAAETSDILVLAQASMATSVEKLSGLKARILTSPELGVERIKRELENS